MWRISLKPTKERKSLNGKLSRLSPFSYKTLLKNDAVIKKSLKKVQITKSKRKEIKAVRTSSIYNSLFEIV